MYTPYPELCVCLVAVADRASEMSGHSTAPCLHTPPGRATLPSSGDYANMHQHEFILEGQPDQFKWSAWAEYGSQCYILLQYRICMNKCDLLQCLWQGQQSESRHQPPAGAFTGHSEITDSGEQKEKLEILDVLSFYLTSVEMNFRRERT